jgi:hypothetical protein
LQLWALVHGLASLELAGDLGDDQRAAAHWEHAVTTGIQGYSTTPAASSSQTVHTR